MSDKARKNLLYRTSPDYRAKALARVKARHALNSTDPDYCRMVALRKEIYRAREYHVAATRRAARLDRRLVDLAHELVQVQARWKAKRGTGK